MIPYARVYEAEQSARDAVAKLKEAGTPEDEVLLLTPESGAEAVARAIDDGRLPPGFLNLGPKELSAGHFIVSVRSAFGRGKATVEALDACNPMRVEVPEVSRSNPSPLSDFLGLAVLSDVRPQTVLSDHDWFPTRIFGRLLTKSRGPVLPGVKLSEPKKNWTKSLGFPMLTKSQGPVLPGKKLSEPKKEWKRSFGFPLLSNNPAPLSSLFGFRTLTSEKKDDEKTKNLRV